QTALALPRELADLGVVADALHAQHLGGDAAVRAAAQPGPGLAVEDAAGEVGLGVEGAPDAHHVGLVTVEDVVDLLGRTDAADREHRDPHPALRLAEEVAVPHRRERRPAPAHVGAGDDGGAP